MAIKIVPRAFNDPEYLARFDREGRILATLHHPNIAGIYGVEESGDLRGLVLELVEGPTLADRLRHGALPMAEALTVARQIADALEAAHEKGIVHRDLKPANIKVGPDAAVKVLDFGLAKDVSAEAVDLTHSPTATAHGTRNGVMLGTAAYMSPEQARARPVDKRTDIWAFGCVLFEMLAGRAPFSRETLSDTIVAILEREPDWSALPGDTPPPIRRLLQRCLDKNPRTRLRDIGDARLESDEATVAPRQAAGRRRGRIIAASAAVLALVAVAAWVAQRADIFWRDPLQGATFTRLTDFNGPKQNAVLSRDGKFFAFLADRDGKWDAWIGQIGTGEVHNLTNGALVEVRNPAVRTLAFSPDGLFVTIWNRSLNASGSALVDGGWAVPAMGGAMRPYLPGIAELDWSPDGSRIVSHPSTSGDPMFVTDSGEREGRQIYAARAGLHNHFQIWSRDGAFIYFVHGFPLDEMDVWRIRPAGGEPERLTSHDSRVTFPTPIDDRTVLYLATDPDGSGPWIYALDANRRTSRRISTGVEEYTSLAASNDGRRLAVTISRSTASLWRVPIADAAPSTAVAVALPTARGLSPRLSAGFMVYRVPRAGTDGLMKVVDGKGSQIWSGADGRAVEGAAIAPDGAHIAFVTQKRGAFRVNIMNADGTAVRRLADDLDVRGAPAWSPDGRWIAVAAARGGADPRLFKIPVDGGAPVSLTGEYALDPIWSPSGRFLVYSSVDIGTTFRVKAVTADGTPRPFPDVVLSRGARRLVFRGGDDALVLLRGDISYKEFWELDLRTQSWRQLTNLGRSVTVGDFDISPDGREIVFDRMTEDSDIVLIDRAPVR